MMGRLEASTTLCPRVPPLGHNSRPGPAQARGEASLPYPQGDSSVSKTAASASSVSVENTRDRLLALHDVAEQLACSPALVRRLGARGVLTRVKIGRLTRYRASDVARLVAEGVPGGGSQTRVAV
jgi:hypothetical protein